MHNLILAIVTFCSTILGENLFFISEGSRSNVPVKNYIGLFVILYIFTFIKHRKIRFVALNMIIFFSFFQMMHIQFFGMPVYPNAIYLMFAESGEMFATLVQNLNLFFIPALLTFPFIYINYLIDKKAFQLKHFKFVQYIFIFYFIFNPLRTFYSGNTWGRQPSTQEFLGTNIYLSLSYFSGKLLPYKIIGGKKMKAYKPEVKFQKEAPFVGNIIFVLGESLSANHLSIFGYGRNTTPYLKSLRGDPSFYYKKGISSGVSTDIAVAMLMNSTYGLKGSEDILTGNNCLFKLAKDNQFNTHFYSSQSQQQLRYLVNSLCLSSVDHYKSLEDIEPHIENSNAANDHKLIDLIPVLDTNFSQNFIILHQRGSHSPYKLRYEEEDKIFKIQGTGKNKRLNHYDNSVHNFDRFMKKLITKVSKYKNPTLIFYVSDHGEGLGEEGVWGHAALKRPSIEVPYLIYSHGIQIADLPRMPKIPTHFNFSLFLSKMLGYTSQYEIHEYPRKYQILGNDLDGFAGYLKVKFHKDTFEIKRKDI